MGGVVFALVAGCGGGATATQPTLVNHAPTIGSLAVSPNGLGVASATIFTFTAEGVADADGDAMSYQWFSSDGEPTNSSTAALAHVFRRVGTFDVKVIVTDPKGASVSMTRSVSVGTLSGVWDIACDIIPLSTRASWPAFPSRFVVTLTQSVTSLFGTLSGGSFTQPFPAPPSVSAANNVRDSRSASFGVEGAFNPWTQRDGDMYFHMDADESLTKMTGTGGYCGSAIATRR